VLAIRLFANMIAGHFVIFSLLLLIFIVHPLASVVSVPLAVFMDLLEVLVVLIQAMVFTLLSASFIGMASSHH
jgi:F-type H+-transporting ATPase subunit a